MYPEYAAAKVMNQSIRVVLLYAWPPAIAPHFNLHRKEEARLLPRALM